MIPSRLTDQISSDLQAVAAKLLQALNPQEHVNLADQLSLIALDYERLVRRYEVPELILAHIGKPEDCHDDIPSIYYG